MPGATAFVGGRVFTGDRLCAALLVEGGIVSVAGSEAEVRRAAPTGTEVRLLGGALVLPGLIDAHLHLAEITRRRDGLDLSGAASLEALATMIRTWADAHPGPAVVGRGFDPERWPGAAWPTREDLDRMAGGRAVVLVHASGHAWVVGSPVLAAAGVDRSTPDPPSGRFGRSPDGAPDGRVLEAAIPFLEARLPDWESVEPAAMLRTLRSTAALGLTTLGAMSVRPDEAVVLRQLVDSGVWPGRVRIYLRGDRWREYFRDPGGPSGPPGRFEVVGVKAFTDGAFGPRTALLSEPYTDAPDTTGIEVGTSAELTALVREASRAGLAPALHAIGDRAVLRALDVVRGLVRPRGRPPRIEHAALTPPSLWPRLDEVRPALVVQPGFVWSDRWLTARLGADRARWAYAFRSLLDRGHVLAGSSDAPYDPIDPWRGLQAAVRRTDPTGASANPDPSEAVDAATAVRLYTVHGGLALGEPRLGRLEPGSAADLVVVRAPTLEAAIAAGASIVLESWVAGEPIRSDPA